MKITIEPTEGHVDYPNPSVVIAYPSDDITTEDAVDMALRAVVAFGYDWQQVFGSDDIIEDLEAKVRKLTAELEAVREPDKKMKRSTPKCQV